MRRIKRVKSPPKTIAINVLDAVAVGTQDEIFDLLSALENKLYNEAKEAGVLPPAVQYESVLKALEKKG